MELGNSPKIAMVNILIFTALLLAMVDTAFGQGKW